MALRITLATSAPGTIAAERITEPTDGARMQLGDARLVHADLGANLLHRGLAVVVEADHLLLARGQRRDRGAHAVLGFLPLVGGVGLFGLRGNQGGGQGRFVEVLVVGQRRGRLDRVDANDGSAEALFVGPDLGGKIGQRRFVTQARV